HPRWSPRSRGPCPRPSPNRPFLHRARLPTAYGASHVMTIASSAFTGRLLANLQGGRGVVKLIRFYSKPRHRSTTILSGHHEQPNAYDGSVHAAIVAESRTPFVRIRDQSR